MLESLLSFVPIFVLKMLVLVPAIVKGISAFLLLLMTAVPAGLKVTSEYENGVIPLEDQNERAYRNNFTVKVVYLASVVMAVVAFLVAAITSQYPVDFWLLMWFVIGMIVALVLAYIFIRMFVSRRAVAAGTTIFDLSKRKIFVYRMLIGSVLLLIFFVELGIEVAK